MLATMDGVSFKTSEMNAIDLNVWRKKMSGKPPKKKRKKKEKKKRHKQKQNKNNKNKLH